MEIASFLQNDPDTLVLASLSCPLCLHDPGRVALADDEDGWWVACWCPECRNDRRVELTEEQALRLTISPVP